METIYLFFELRVAVISAKGRSYSEPNSVKRELGNTYPTRKYI